MSKRFLTNINAITASLTGKVTASAFAGDGSLLTNIPAGTIANNSLSPAVLTASTITIGSTAVGLGTTLTNISTSGTGSFSGRVTASAFAGDGSLLTNLPAPVIANNSLSPAVLTASTIKIGSTVIGLGGTLTNISTSGTGSFSGRVTASAFSGDGNLISNINGTSIVNNSIAPAALTASTITIGSTVVGLGQTITNISTSGTGSFSGRVTASAFAGDGSLLTNLPSSGTSGSAFNNLSASGTASVNNLTVYGTGSIVGKITAASFSGNGAELTNVPTPILMQTDEYTSPGTYTWVKPTSFTIAYVDVIVTGAGGGGGGGAKTQSTNAYATGGGGGGGGAVVSYRIPNNMLTASMSLMVGAGGKRGNSASTNGSFDGSNGENSYFGFVMAAGGTGGQGGNTQTSAGAASAIGGTGGGGFFYTNLGGNPTLASANFIGASLPLAIEQSFGGYSRNSNNTSGMPPSNTSSFMPSAGGSGGSSQTGRVTNGYNGSIAASTNISASIAGGLSGSSGYTSTGSVSASGTHGSPGSISPAFNFFGSGGGGGGSASAPGGGSANYLGGNGGDGVRGGGGGGGGSLALITNALPQFRSVSGSGGNGGDGYIIVYTYGY